MNITRINEFRAKEGQAQALREFLGGVAKLVGTLEGCRSCQLLENQDKPGRFVVLESWESREAHQGAVKNIPKETLQKVMPLLAEPPRGDYFFIL